MTSRPGGPNPSEPDPDPFAEYDAAYVFGALAPDDRAAFERHLQHCDDCGSAVAAMAGIPGLLSRVPLGSVIGTPADAPLPDTLLPRLVTEVRRERSRSRWRVGAATALAAACVLGLLVALVVDRRSHPVAGGQPGTTATGSVTGTGPSTTTPSNPRTAAGPVLTMAPVSGQGGFTASVQLQSVLWGTRISLKCSEPSAGPTAPYAGLYYLVVIGRDSSRHTVADWRSLAGKTVQINGATGLRRADIASLQLLDADRDLIANLRL